MSKKSLEVWRRNNPLRDAYNNFKHNAKRRGIEFSVSLEEFRVFCAKYNYLELRGRFAGCLSIDRKISSKGYTFENMQALTVRENMKKRFYEPLYSKEEREQCPF